MDKSAIEKIIGLAEPNIIDEGGYKYTDKPLSVIAEPRAGTLNFYTIKGLTDTLKVESDYFNSPIIVAITKHNEITVHTAINANDRSREIPYTAIAEVPNFEYGRFTSYEEMMIALKSKFVETPELIGLVQLLGTITEENSTALTDDGFSQSVVVRKGIALKDNKVVNPKVKLIPFRTFADVKQPESEFLLRLKDGGYVALFEADGGAWKLEARANVSDVLKTELDNLIQNNTVIIVE